MTSWTKDETDLLLRANDLLMRVQQDPQAYGEATNKAAMRFALATSQYKRGDISGDRWVREAERFMKA